MNKTGLSRSSVYKFISEGHFPQSIATGPRSVAWLDSDIEEWILDRIAERYDYKTVV
ncbi:AlpA family phage regulatory protein [Psychromonas antarctica]|uniref:AlpA family phage regulatory protein n=1 Tax=Psychromonas antarctica TaxID=67573 RepID=UPI001EE868B8|nr:AlpA family transcriptional regulator [Psychromonas antarctica]MCG6202328.1 AlpA family transcriptional regulator [Psychromonas antarctica]